MLAKDILTKSRYLLIFTILLFTACAPQATTATIPPSTSVPTETEAPLSSPTSVSPTAKAPVPSLTPTATLDHSEIPPELVGTWAFMAFGEPWTAELTADGKYSLYPPNGQLDIGGSYGISGSEAIFRDEVRGNGVLCVPAEGRYHWEVIEDQLVFTVIEDKCTAGRIEQWTVGWQRVEK